MRLSADEKRARTVMCPFCFARPGKPCVYTDGAFKGAAKASGAHAVRMITVKDEELFR